MPYCAAARASSAASRLRCASRGSAGHRRLRGNARRPDRPPEYDSNAVFPGRRHTMPKVRAFVDFLVQRPDFDADYVLAQCPLQAAYAKPSERREDGKKGRQAGIVDRHPAQCRHRRTGRTCQAHADGTSAGLTRRSTTPRVAASRSISQTKTGRIAATRFVMPVPLASRACCRFDQERSGTTRISTRRFCARPASVALSAIG